MNRRLYALHRWISLLALVQLAIWSASGLVFTTLSEEAVMSRTAAGAHDVTLVDAGDLMDLEVLRVRARREHHGARVFRIELRSVGDRLAYLVRGDGFVARYDARSGEALPVDRQEAEHVASRDQEGAPRVREARLIESDPPIEFRGRPLPGWRVVLNDPESTAVWVDARTGDVAARRTSTWGIYDFFWSLHIMDYGGRDDFRHPLIIVFAVFANLTAITGLVLWLTRAVRALRRARPATTGDPSLTAGQ